MTGKFDEFNAERASQHDAAGLIVQAVRQPAKLAKTENFRQLAGLSPRTEIAAEMATIYQEKT
jgi:hypothetical protein